MHVFPTDWTARPSFAGIHARTPGNVKPNSAERQQPQPPREGHGPNPARQSRFWRLLYCMPNNTSGRHHRYIKALLIIAALAVLGGAWHSGAADFLHDPKRIVNFIHGEGLRGMALFCAIFVIGGSLGVPPVLFVIAAGLLWPFAAALAISMTSGLLAAMLGFFLSRYIAHDFFHRHIPKRIQRYSEGLRRHGFRTVVVLRLLFYLFPPVSWMIGLSRIRARDYIAGTLIGALPLTVLYTLLGRKWIPWLLSQDPLHIALVALALVLFAGLAVRSRLKKKRKAAQEPVPGAKENLAHYPETDRECPVGFSLFLSAARLYLRLSFRAFFPPRPYRRPPSLKRCGMLLVFLPAFGLLQLIHWLAFWIDELLYPRYRDINIESPLFIVGIPRSGTTFLHRVFARDTGHFTIFELWELLFAPAICERKLLLGLQRLDRKGGAPIARTVSWISRRMTGGLEDVHKLSLHEAEEDFLLLMPTLACYILVVVFPFAPEIQNLAAFDTKIPDKRRQQILDFYHGMLQKHLYVHGTNRTILSKNVSFTPVMKALIETFPDARVIACARDPEAAVPSQISAMEGSWRLFGIKTEYSIFQQRWINLMRYYYQHLTDMLSTLPEEQAICFTMQELRQDVEDAVRQAYARFGYKLSPAFESALAEESAASRAYRSRHKYSLDDYGISPELIEQEFAPLWEKLEKQCRRRRLFQTGLSTTTTGMPSRL